MEAVMPCDAHDSEPLVGVIEAHRDNLRWSDWRKRPHTFERRRLLVEAGGAEHIPAHAKDLAVNNFAAKDVVALLKSANGCHIVN